MRFTCLLWLVRVAADAALPPREGLLRPLLDAAAVDAAAAGVTAGAVATNSAPAVHQQGSWQREDKADELSLAFTPTELCALRNVAAGTAGNITAAANQCGCGIVKSREGGYQPKCGKSAWEDIELGEDCGLGGNPAEQRFHDCNDWQQALLRWKTAESAVNDAEKLVVEALAEQGKSDFVFVGDSVMKQTVAAFICAIKRSQYLSQQSVVASVTGINVKNHGNLSEVRDAKQRKRLVTLRGSKQLTLAWVIDLKERETQLLVTFSNFIPLGGLAKLAHADQELIARIKWAEGASQGALVVMNQGIISRFLTFSNLI